MIDNTLRLFRNLVDGIGEQLKERGGTEADIEALFATFDKILATEKAALGIEAERATLVPPVAVH